MQHYWFLDQLALKDVWLTIGAFDGVHLGHQALIQYLTQSAHVANLQAVVFTFHPHPAKVLNNRQGVAYLTSPDERAALLGELGVDVVVTYPFTQEVAQLSAEDFISRLHQRLRMSRLCVGPDFALGRGRQGNIPLLRSLGEQFGYILDVIPPTHFGNQVVSSSQIRSALAKGEVRLARNMLGRPYQLSGKVVPGDGRGRTIGIPTANLQIWTEKMLPKNGVYATQTKLGNRVFASVTNIGYRPTFANQPPQPQVEVHLLDFDQDLYQQQLTLSFVERLRDEQRFPNVQTLVDQIHLDIEKARGLLIE